MRVALGLILLALGGALVWGALNAQHCPVAPLRREGFADAAAATAPQTELNNILLKTMTTLKRMNGYLTSPSVWAERIALYRMTPGELARLQLQPQQ